MGWNDIHAARSSRLLANFGERPDFYFVHSFVFKPLQSEDILATTDYGETFPSIINRGNIYGVQFHPEKSQKSGTLILKNFLSLS